MNKLMYADLEGLLTKIGEKDSGRISFGLIYRAILETHKIFGSRYTIDTCIELAGDPQGHGLHFKPELAKKYFIKYLERAYKYTQDDNYCKAIEHYTNDLNLDVSRFAKHIIEGLIKTENKKQYEKLKLRTTGYILGICRAIREMGGDEELIKAIDLSAKNSAHNVKVEKLAQLSNKAEALGKELEALLNEFNTSDVTVTQDLSKYTVENPDCGCLQPFIQLAEKYGFAKTEARNYACRRCMPSYEEASIQLGLGFNGKLTKHGCFMEFIKGKKDAKL